MSTTTTSRPAASTRVIMATSVAATISTVLPGFLVGAISVQAIADFEISEARYGWGLGSFFLGATAGSAVLGRSAQHLGPRRQVLTALVITAATSVAIAAFATTFSLFLGLLAVAGLSNSANQSAVNLLLTQAKIERLGLALSLKQSGMPAAAMLGGLMVPIVAVTFGWRVAYVISGLMALVAAIAVAVLIERPPPVERSDPAPLVTPHRNLTFASIGFGCLAAAAGSLNAWTVSSAVEAGIDPGSAGLLLSAGAGLGIVVRVLLGVRLDSLRQNPLLIAAGLSSIGALGLVISAIGSSTAVVIGTLVAFGAGWVWPVLTNYAIVRTNRAAAATATGITQTGVYVGVFGGPLVTGVLIETVGYSVMWLSVAAVMLVGVGVVSRTMLQP